MTDKQFDFESLEPFTVRGIRSPIEQYRLRGERSRGTEMISQVTMTLVDRVDEMALLKSWSDLSLTAGRQLCWMSGEAGVGKTRLCKELMVYCLSKGLKPHRVVARSIYQFVSYGLIFDWLRILLEIEDVDAVEQQKAALRAELTALKVTNQDLEILMSLFPDRAALTTRSDFALVDRTVNLTRVLKLVLDKLSAESSALFCFDSMQWADRASMELLANLFANCQGRYLTVMVARDPRKDTLQLWHQLTVKPLKLAAAKLFVHKLIGVETLKPLILDRVIRKSAGNPLILEEIVATLAENRSLTSVSLSPNLNKIMQARISALPKTVQSVLNAAAMLGNEFDPRVLLQITGNSDSSRGSLTFLQERGILEPLYEFEPPLLCFHNPLLREIVINNLLKEELRELSRSIATTMEEIIARGAHSSLVNFAIMAEHFEQAGNHDKAREYFERAADTLAMYGDLAAAAALYEKTLRLAQLGDADLQESGMLKIKIARLSTLMEDFSYALKALNTIDAKGDDLLALTAQKELARIYRLQGERKKARDLLAGLAERLTGNLHPELYIEIVREHGVVLYQMAQYDEAIIEYQRALKKAKAQHDPELIARCLNEIGLVHLTRGAFGSALQYFLESLALREQIGNQHAIAVLLPNIARTYHLLNQIDQAMRHYDRALEITEYIGDRRTHAIVCHNKGEVLIDLGRYRQAHDNFQAAFKIAVELGFRELANLSAIQLGLSVGLSGETTAGIDKIRSGLKEAGSLGSLENQIYAWLALGTLFAKSTDNAKAGRYFARAKQQANALGHQELLHSIEKRLRNS